MSAAEIVASHMKSLWHPRENGIADELRCMGIYTDDRALSIDYEAPENLVFSFPAVLLASELNTVFRVVQNDV